MKIENSATVPGSPPSQPLRLAPSSSGRALEDALDEALDESFPASDPVAIKIERALNRIVPLR
jgi:hypothetical protein